MTAVKLPPFTGMNNRAKDTDLPEGKLRNAVNVQFSNGNEIIFPRVGSTLVHAGDCHSLYGAYFVKSGDLKRLNDDNTATTVKAGIGNDAVAYTVAGGDTYYTSATARGKISNGVSAEWGVKRPPRQPDCTPVSIGGLYAGDYRVAITWINADGEESGTGQGKRVTVTDGGGIHVSNFPTAPSDVTLVAVYVSEVNGKDMLLYGEYPIAMPSITLTRKINSVPLQTQFCYQPMPLDIICAHYGRIYYARGNRVYKTMLGRYGLQKAHSYWTFANDVKVIISTPNVLYIGTSAKLYKIVNIDGDGTAIVEELQNCGAVKGSVAYDPDGKTAYCMTGRGFMAFSPEGVVELTYEQVAIPSFESGTTTVTERDGLKYLTFVGKGATQNPLGNTAYNAAELARNSL